MSNEKWPQLGPMELARGLSICAGYNCNGCPFHNPVAPKESCGDELNRQAAEVIRKMVEATENICRENEARMAALAGEMNTAADWGLVGTNKEQFEELLKCQGVLTELGRNSMVRTVPLEPDGWRVLGIQVEDRVIFGEMGSDEGGGSGG